MPHLPRAKMLWTLLSILVIIGLIALNYLLKQNMSNAFTTSTAIDTACDLRKAPCHTTLPNGEKVSFAITPNHIPLLKALQLQVNTEGFKTAEIEKIEVNIIGLNMDMGYNHTRLIATTKNDFKGTTTIPICIRRKMEWQANVLLYTSQGQISVPFRFHTLKYDS